MGILSGLLGNKAYEGLFKLEINGKENHATIFNMRTEAIVEQFYTRKSGGPYNPRHVTWSDNPVKQAFKWMQSHGKHALTVNELIVMRILAALLCSSIIYITYKMGE